MLADHIAAMRRFNRFYTQRIGILNPSWLDSAHSLTEVRVLYELAHHAQATASELVQTLKLDPGYVSRILAGFEKKKVIEKVRAEDDGRRVLIGLTKQGRKLMADLDRRADEDLHGVLGVLGDSEQ